MLIEEPPTERILENETSRRGANGAPARSEARREAAARDGYPSLQKADKVMLMLYPNEDFVMLSIFETVTTSVCKIGSTHVSSVCIVLRTWNEQCQLNINNCMISTVGIQSIYPWMFELHSYMHMSKRNCTYQLQKVMLLDNSHIQNYYGSLIA